MVFIGVEEPFWQKSFLKHKYIFGNECVVTYQREKKWIYFNWVIVQQHPSSNLDTKKRCYKTNGVGDPQLSPIKQATNKSGTPKHPSLSLCLSLSNVYVYKKLSKSFFSHFDSFLFLLWFFLFFIFWIRFSRIRFENGRIGPEWRRRGGYGICNRKRGTRSASTVRRRIRNGRRCRTACSCAWSAPASTAASASTSPSSDPSPWTPGPRSRSRKWSPAATSSSTRSSRSTGSLKRPTSWPSTTPTPPAFTGTESRPWPKGNPGGTRRSWRRAPDSANRSRRWAVAGTVVMGAMEAEAAEEGGIVGIPTMDSDLLAIWGETSRRAMWEAPEAWAVGPWDRNRPRTSTRGRSWRRPRPIRRVSLRESRLRTSPAPTGFRRRKAASMSGLDPHLRLLPRGMTLREMSFPLFLRFSVECVIVSIGAECFELI